MKNSLKQKYQYYLTTKSLPLWFLFFATAVFIVGVYTRAEGIGYSNFQGDEVNTVDFMYQEHNGFVDYLLSQKRGPTQYIINKLNISIFGYINEFYIRLPYLFFALLAFITFYFLAKKVFNKPTALFTALILSINGLFIAFARITQYQSVMYFLVPFGVFTFIKAFRNPKSKALIISAMIMCLALFTHYDTLSVMPFFIVFFVMNFLREKSKDKKVIIWYLNRAALFFGICIIPTLIFYIPMSQSDEFNRTSGYLTGRLFGGGFMPRTGHILGLISMYVPQFVLGGLYVLAILSPLFWWRKLDGINLKKFKISSKHLSYFYILLIGLNIFGTIFSLYPIKPRLSSLIVTSTAITIVALLTFFAKKVRIERVAILTWFLGAYSFYFFIMKDPRTHVYVVFIPGMILAGYTLYKLYSLNVNKFYRVGYLATICLVLLYITGFNYKVFIEKWPEYPWFDKTYFGQAIYDIPKVRHKKIDGVFGFNNYRAWAKVADYYKTGCLTGTFNSNEKNSITYFYMRTDQKRGDQFGFEPNADILVVVEGPHSWEYANNRNYVGYKLVKTIRSYGIPVTEIYSKDLTRDYSCLDD